MNKKYLEALNIIKFNPDDVDGLQYLEAFKVVEQALLELKAIKEANPSVALELVGYLKDYLLNMMPYYDWLNEIEKYILKVQEQEKENELLKEIIKSFFDRGCPLHQYTNKEGILTIEVDDECSIMHLGEFKGVDLDKKLKEVLE